MEDTTFDAITFAKSNLEDYQGAIDDYSKAIELDLSLIHI